MSPSTLRTLSGGALVVAGPACIVGGMAHPIVHGHAHSAAAVTSGTEVVSFTGLLVGTVLLLMGLPGVYGWRAARLGGLGLAGYVLYMLGNLLSAVPHVVVNGLIAPEVARRAPDLISHHDLLIDSDGFAVEQVSTGVVLIAGLLLLGIALMRDPALPRWIGALGVIGAVLQMIPFPGVPVVSGIQIELARGLMIVALGVLAIRSTRVADEAPPVAAAWAAPGDGR